MGRSRPSADEIRVLVVDNDPSPETRSLCRQLASGSCLPIEYLSESRRGLVRARNTMVEEALARGAELVAFLDDDDLPDLEWLEHLARAQRAEDADIVAGNRRFPGRRPPSSGKSEAERARKLGVKSVAGRRVPKAAATANLLVRADILRKLAERGPVFDPRFADSGGEDEDFFLRAAALGARFAFASLSVVTQYHDSERFTVRGAFRRGFKTGCARLNLVRRHEPESEQRVVWRALGKGLWVSLLLPLQLAHGGLPRLSYRLGKSLGTLSFRFTGRTVRYYGRDPERRRSSAPVRSQPPDPAGLGSG
jgi:GT2 family glycosyltransferase